MSESIESPRIENVESRIFCGMKIRMSFTDNKTAVVWSKFMPKRTEITNRADHMLYSIEEYPRHFFDPFQPDTTFHKWAAVRINGDISLPEGMEILHCPPGLYAVFTYVGTVSDAPGTYNYIFNEWLPKSSYNLDERPHFAVMDHRYKHNDPDSEEEIWIPVKPREIPSGS